MTTVPTQPHEVVEDFLAALERLDLDAAVALLDADVVYQNVSLPAARGRERTRDVLAMLTRYATGFEAHIHRIATDGDTVLTERTDAIVIGRLRSAFWVCGTFEVRDGRIVLWRDYFDWAAVLGATAVGAGRAALGALTSRPAQPRGGRSSRASARA